jgi:glutathione S-transferase
MFLKLYKFPQLPRNITFPSPSSHKYNILTWPVSTDPTLTCNIPPPSIEYKYQLIYQSSIMGSNDAPNIILYTNHGCPWAHRAHIALAELGLPYKEEIIDLTVPRTPEYLAVNPRGLVPSINYNGTIITESAIVAQFLSDAHPSHLEKTSTEEGGALQRAKINFFVDTFITKVNGQTFGILRASEEEKPELAVKLVDAIVKEVEPLLQDAKPFFGGSSKLTLAEVWSH